MIKWGQDKDRTRNTSLLCLTQVSYMKRFLVGEDKESWRLFIKAVSDTIVR